MGNWGGAEGSYVGMLWQGGTVGGSCGVGVGAVWGTGWGGAEGSYVGMLWQGGTVGGSCGGGGGSSSQAP